MDPLGPMSVPHDPVHVSILAKQAHEKVFGDALSTACILEREMSHPSVHLSIHPSIHPSS